MMAAESSPARAPFNRQITSSPARLQTDRPSIWLVSARVGAGHVQAARAIEEALVLRGLRHRVRFIDVMQHVPGWFRSVYAGGYARLASRWPGLYGLGYHLSDLPRSDWPNRGERMRVALEERMIAPLRDDLETDPPDWIVHTHFLAPAVLGRWIRAARLHTRQAVVVTDFHPHRIWLAEQVDRYFVACEAAQQTLVRRGLTPDQIEISGIPILARHRRRVDREAARQHFGWPADRPVLLLLSGSDFVTGPFLTVLERLLQAFPEAIIQVATGRNESLYRQVCARAATNRHLRVIGFTEWMHELLVGATIVLSKTGGITTSECLAHGAAMVGLFPLPGQEALNADYLAARGAGVKISSVAQVVPAVAALLENERALEALRGHAARLGRPHAADAVADTLLPALTGRAPVHCA
jgi:processive 1,2-diacylglycerol beta-glucosyltransferase